TDPTNVFAMDDIKFMTGYNVEPVVASDGAVGEALDKYYTTAPVKKVEAGPDCFARSLRTTDRGVP
ncbi:MAG: type pilus assembly protein PilB, partial [Acidobacteriota bacterium]|nr:type pilus assembly protein PilB [Acidobacteriota bacterium]